MTTNDSVAYRARLQKEHDGLTEELKSVGAQNPATPSDWVARAPNENEMNIEEADRSEAGDRMEELGLNVGLVDTLEVRLNNVNRALEKIEKGAFGVCELCGKEIEHDRLEANPSARTCIADRDREEELSR